MARNVLIVTESFPPTNDIAARRFGFLAPHLERHGWGAWVLTTQGEGPLPVRLPAERLFRIGRGSNTLPRRAPAEPADRRNTVRRLRQFAWSTLRRTIDLTGSRVFSLYPANFAWRRCVENRRDEIRSWLPPIDLVIGSFMPAAAAMIAANLAHDLRVPWLADIRDLASEIPGRRNPLARGLDRLIERRLFRTAAGFLTVSPTLAELLSNVHRRAAAVIYNGWDADGEREGHAEGSAAAKGAHQSPGLYYAGILYPHRMAAAFAVLEAMAARPGVRWTLRSLGPAVLEDRLKREARRLNVDDRLEILSACDPTIVARESAAALANLVLEELDRRHLATRGTLTGKFLKLLPLGRPVLAVARSDSDIGPILERTATGRLCSTPAQIVDFLDAAAAAPAEFRGRRAAVAEFSMEVQAARLAGLLDRYAGGDLAARSAA
ncbi:MAG: hypothetical protein KY476_04055 [Planctomycetes bacterium]|nr:hypothetical protein [Planctomycetota bacterium]